MLKKNMILSMLLMLFISFGCSSKKIAIDTFKLDVQEVNNQVKILDKRLTSKACGLKKDSLLKLQKKNYSVIDKVLKLHNLLSYTKYSFKNKKEIEESLDNALKNLFLMRQNSKKRLLALASSEIDENFKENEEFLCSLEVKPISKIEACTDCVAVFN